MEEGEVHNVGKEGQMGVTSTIAGDDHAESTGVGTAQPGAEGIKVKEAGLIAEIPEQSLYTRRCTLVVQLPMHSNSNSTAISCEAKMEEQDRASKRERKIFLMVYKNLITVKRVL